MCCLPAKRIVVWLVTVLLVSGAALVNAGDRDQEYADLAKLADQFERSSTSHLFQRVIKLMSPAVVRVSAETKIKHDFTSQQEELFRRLFPDREFSPRRQPPREIPVPSSGSGVIIDPAGYIVTNNHVVAGIEGPDKVTVLLADDHEYQAVGVWTDPETDLAVLKIDASNLPVARFGDSEKMQVGDWVLAFGAPFGSGFQQTVTHGIVSFSGRSNVVDNRRMPYQRFIQTDAAVNRGNSGGPLVNIRGEVIGINTLIFSTSGGAQGISLAIPSETVQWVVPQLKRNHRVRKGYLGTGIHTFNPEMKSQYSKDALDDTHPSSLQATYARMAKLDSERGAFISEIAPNGPAAKAGLKQGDVIVTLDNARIASSEELVHAVARKPVNSTVEIGFYRDGKRQTAKVKLSERTRANLASLDNRFRATQQLLGITVESLDEKTTKQMGLEDKGGVKVATVDDDSSASGELKTGDVIVEVNYEAVTSPESLELRLRTIERGAPITLRVYRREGGTTKKLWPVIKSKDK